MNCDICKEPFDHSIRKPFVLSACGHTYCLCCLKQLTVKKCPQCRKKFKEILPNITLLNLIPESNYDKLKIDSLKSFSELNNDLKNSRDQKLKEHEDKLESIKQVISYETAKLIGILKNNENKLKNECDVMLNQIKIHFDTNIEIPSMESLNGITKEAIQNNEVDEDALKSYNNKICKMKQQSNQLSDKIKNYQFNYKFDLNIILNENLLIGELNTSRSYNNKGFSLFDSNKYGEAIKFLEKAIESDPNNSSAYCNKGFALSKLDRFEDALKCYNKTIELNPNNSSDYNNKGFALNELNMFEEALQCFDKSIELIPNNSPAYSNKGFALIQLNRFEDALPCFDKSIELNPNNSSDYNNKGFALNELNMFEEALQCFDKAIELNPNNSLVYTNKSLLLVDLNKYEEAIECLDKAIALNSIMH